VAAALGELAGWLAARLWNAAAPRLPTAPAAQLVAAETMAALPYAAALERAWPPAPVLAGAVLSLAGVALALRAFHRPGSG
jgi:drug/metabolite transporter (DMT)-like permease